MDREIDLEIGPFPEKYLDLRPQDSYRENIEALDDVLQGEYDEVGEAYADMHGRVFHSTFSQFYDQDSGPVRIDAEALEDMQEVLERKSEQDRFWPEEKLFNFGYGRGLASDALRSARENPRIPYGRDMIPDFDMPTILENPVRKGKLKREGDEYYSAANQWIVLDIGDQDIEIV